MPDNKNFDIVIVGSGFGGTLAATLLMQMGKRVLVLERGTWWVTPEKLGKPPAPDPQKPGDFVTWANAQNPPQPVQYWPRPNHKEGLFDFFAAVRTPLNRRGLYDYHTFDEIDILTASGVGGGSLVYSNVNLQANPDVLKKIGLTISAQDYQNARTWMEQKRGRFSKIVTKIPLPGRDVNDLGTDDFLYLDRSRALKDAAEKTGPALGLQLKWEPIELSVTEYEEDAQHHAGGKALETHTFCERQGRCILGCLPQARHTLNKVLYSQVLWKPENGVTLIPRAEVRHIARVADGYEVSYRDHRADDDGIVRTKAVFLAAGTLGSTKILLRSRDENRLPLNDRIGKKFSSNGDFAGFVYGTGSPVYSTRGPINTSHVQVVFEGSHMTVEDAAIPEMFASIASTALGILDRAGSMGDFATKLKMLWSLKRPALEDIFPGAPRTDDPNAWKTEAEMVSNIFFFNASAEDEPIGEFRLKDGSELDLSYPLSKQTIFDKIDKVLRVFGEQMRNKTPGQEGKYIPFPLWKGLGIKKVVTVHPLGGCTIGSDHSNGTVDQFGRIFDTSKPPASKAVLPNLYVIDGSVIPGPLAVNPTWTICAQAHKAVTNALQELR